MIPPFSVACLGPTRDTSSHQVSRQNQRFRLKAHSVNGSVTVFIPSDFEGPVTFSTLNGSTTFSQPIKKRLAHFGGADGTNKAFIGSVEGSGFADLDKEGESAWRGDELELSSEYGSIKVYCAEEIGEVEGAGPIRFFKRLFSGAGSSGGGSGSPPPPPPAGGSGFSAVNDQKS